MRTVAFWLMVFISPYVNAQSVPSMAQFEIALAPTQTLPLTDRISFELITSEPVELSKKLQKWRDISIEQIGEKKLLIEMGEQSQFSGKVSDKYLLDSFVIDFSELSTKAFISGFIDSQYQPIELTKLEAYVDEYIDKPTYVNGFNIASVVARQRSGDCTEYAVLLTALARSIGLPSRVIIGTVIVEEKEKISAFGHAWVETWHDGEWAILDAALYKSQALKHFYLPAGELDKEGPGYSMSLIKATRLLPTKINAVQNAK